jgi:hypothetical protein
MGKFFLQMVLIALAGMAQAQDLRPDRLLVPLISDHVNDRSNSLNEFNPGLVLGWDGGFADLSLGVLRNSFGDPAPVVTLSRDIWGNEACALAVFAGTARYTALQGRVSYERAGWVPIGGLHLECGPVFLQALPGAGLSGDDSAKGQAKAILLAGLRFDLGHSR